MFKYVDLLKITVPSGVVALTEKSQTRVPNILILSLSPVRTA